MGSLVELGYPNLYSGNEFNETVMQKGTVKQPACLNLDPGWREEKNTSPENLSHKFK